MKYVMFFISFLAFMTICICGAVYFYDSTVGQQIGILEGTISKQDQYITNQNAVIQDQLNVIISQEAQLSDQGQQIASQGQQLMNQQELLEQRNQEIIDSRFSSGDIMLILTVVLALLAVVLGAIKSSQSKATGVTVSKVQAKPAPQIMVNNNTVNVYQASPATKRILAQYNHKQLA